jgi:CheY-like chemotaxis protein
MAHHVHRPARLGPWVLIREFWYKGVGKGTGLGLSMIVGMAEQCGGKLVLRSTKSEGTTAEIWLPVAAGELLPEVAHGESENVGRFVDPLTILAVDDDEIVLINTAAMLSDLGHTVIQSRSGHEAMRILRKHRIDLLITDFAMPGMTGAELVEAAQAGWSELLILMVSGYAELPEGTGTGIQRLAKPFRQTQLAAAIAAVMQQGT